MLTFGQGLAVLGILDLLVIVVTSAYLGWTVAHVSLPAWNGLLPTGHSYTLGFLR